MSQIHQNEIQILHSYPQRGLLIYPSYFVLYRLYVISYQCEGGADYHSPWVRDNWAARDGRVVVVGFVAHMASAFIPPSVLSVAE